MNKKWLFLLVPPGIVLFVWIFGEVVMHLWNWLLPNLFGWHPINFWQGLGLLVLCRILFGGFGGHGRDGSKFKRRAAERWEKLTPEEREKFRQSLRGRCGSFEPPTGENPTQA